MKKLLSLPPNTVRCFHDITGLPREDYFCGHDPIGHRLGSGGGTIWLLKQAEKEFLSQGDDDDKRRIVIHAGGHSRRLPAYAPSGKSLIPIPVFRWERGQRLRQTLLDLQTPLLEKIMAMAPKSLTTMVASGDVYIRAAKPLQPVPDADVVCYGLWLPAETAKSHGVFVSSRQRPTVLKRMVQKPSTDYLSALLTDHFYLTDIGLWLMSDKAVGVLEKKAAGQVPYDLYAQFGGALGTDPLIEDEEISGLSVAIVPLSGGEFYHFGSGGEMIRSMLNVMNIVSDQRLVLHHSLKPHPSIFIQNADVRIAVTGESDQLWIENSCVGRRWRLSRRHIITGVPDNDWKVSLAPGQCVDIVPMDDSRWAVRTYMFDETFAGGAQFEKRFPVVGSVGEIRKWLEEGKGTQEEMVSADDISRRANLRRLLLQRERYYAGDWTKLALNWKHSVFYQLDLDDARKEFHRLGITLPPPPDDDAPLMTRVHDAMFRGDSATAFTLLRQRLTDTVSYPQRSHPSVYQDQIVWARSPLRIDIAGGWTDTPPYCLMEGSKVVNIAVELNGQPPIQTFVRPAAKPGIILRSIDMGVAQEISTYEELNDFRNVGSPFSIPKAALVLAGFQPACGGRRYASLSDQMDDFGCGIEMTLLSAVPAGSGMGASSILAATVLGALGDFCSLAWDSNEICLRTLALEQMITTGGGWQDQFGGILQGVKLLETKAGMSQRPLTRWMPDYLFTEPDYRACHLLYYTGIKRVAKTLLAKIVEKMFLNQHEQLLLLREMKEHATEMYETIQTGDFQRMGALVKKTWRQNQTLDSGTNIPEVKMLTDMVDDLCLGYKLPGAGGGGYLYMIAKDPEAAARVRQIINANRTNSNARFVDMTLSTKGFQVSRS